MWINHQFIYFINSLKIHSISHMITYSMCNFLNKFISQCFAINFYSNFKIRIAFQLYRRKQYLHADFIKSTQLNLDNKILLIWLLIILWIYSFFLPCLNFSPFFSDIVFTVKLIKMVFMHVQKMLIETFYFAVIFIIRTKENKGTCSHL